MILLNLIINYNNQLKNLIIIFIAPIFLFKFQFLKIDFLDEYSLFYTYSTSTIMAKYANKF